MAIAKYWRFGWEGFPLFSLSVLSPKRECDFTFTQSKKRKEVCYVNIRRLSAWNIDLKKKGKKSELKGPLAPCAISRPGWTFQNKTHPKRGRSCGGGCGDPTQELRAVLGKEMLRGNISVGDTGNKTETALGSAQRCFWGQRCITRAASVRAGTARPRTVSCAGAFLYLSIY